MLEIENLHRPGLSPFSLNIKDGECVALMGPSGSGKSLALRAIADLDPNEGMVRSGNMAREQVPAPVWRQKIGFLPAQSGWWSEYVGTHMKKTDQLSSLLNKLDLPQDCLNWPISRLSTGEKQRLALIRLLNHGPEVLLLDEPTSALDEDARLRVENLLKEQIATGASILLTTHDKHQARRLCRRVLLIHDGVVSEANP